WCSRPRAEPNRLAGNLWLLVPIQQKRKESFAVHGKVPHQEANSQKAGGIGFGLPPKADAKERLKKLEQLTLHQDGSAPESLVATRSSTQQPARPEIAHVIGSPAVMRKCGFRKSAHNFSALRPERRFKTAWNARCQIIHQLRGAIMKTRSQLALALGLAAM